MRGRVEFGWTDELAPALTLGTRQAS
jgi:hypothetical protein